MRGLGHRCITAWSGLGYSMGLIGLDEDGWDSLDAGHLDAGHIVIESTAQAISRN